LLFVMMNVAMCDVATPSGTLLLSLVEKV